MLSGDNFMLSLFFSFFLIIFFFAFLSFKLLSIFLSSYFYLFNVLKETIGPKVGWATCLSEQLITWLSDQNARLVAWASQHKEKP